MARGGKQKNHKGGRKQFTNPDELERNRVREEKEREWRRQHGQESSSEEDSDKEDDEDEDGVAFKKADESESESESESSEDEDRKKKGTEGLIAIENPNRRPQRQKKASELDAEVAGSVAGAGAAIGGAAASSAGPVPAAKKVVEKPELSRREREEIEKARAKAHYQKMHAAGKTEEARADLARLAIIRKQREDAAKKREDEKLAKENAGKPKGAEAGAKKK